MLKWKPKALCMPDEFLNLQHNLDHLHTHVDDTRQPSRLAGERSLIPPGIMHHARDVGRW